MTAQRPHTAGLTAYLPSFLPALFPRPGALLQLAVDAERHILYARSQTSGIQVRCQRLPVWASICSSSRPVNPGGNRGQWTLVSYLYTARPLASRCSDMG